MRYTKVISEHDESGRMVHYVAMLPCETGMFPAGLHLSNQFYSKDWAETFAGQVDEYIDRLMEMKAAEPY